MALYKRSHEKTAFAIYVTSSTPSRCILRQENGMKKNAFHKAHYLQKNTKVRATEHNMAEKQVYREHIGHHSGSRLLALFKMMRPRQWTKNLTLFIGLVFAQQLFVPTALIRAIIGFCVFCLASSCIYLLNDLIDLEKDRQHPTKRLRPLAAGQLPVSWVIAGIGGILLLCSGITLSIFALPARNDLYADLGGPDLLFTSTVGSYLLLMALYTTYLKHIVLVDVFVIAAGFVLRIIAGAVIVPVVISPWLYLVACFLSLFLAFSKRRNELVILQELAGNHRKNLKEYSLPLLDQLIMITVTCTLVAYSLYTIEGQTGNRRLIVTIPFVLYALFRYLYLVYIRMEGGSPEEVLLRDRHMLGTVMLCTITIIALLYIWK